MGHDILTNQPGLTPNFLTIYQVLKYTTPIKAESLYITAVDVDYGDRVTAKLPEASEVKNIEVNIN